MKLEVFWKNPEYKARPELREDIECDYLIVGGGVTGISTAYFLAKMGAENIVIIEKNEIASGATGKAAGTLVLRGESDLVEIIASQGKAYGAKYWQEIHNSMAALRKVIASENIDCDAEPQDTLYCDQSAKSEEYLREEFEAEHLIEKTTQYLQGDALKRELNSPLFGHGILSKNHGLSVNPLKFTQNFSKVVEKLGVKCYENTALLDRAHNVARTAHGKIRYKKCVMAVDAAHPSAAVQNMKSTIVVTQPLTDAQLKETGLDKRKIVFDAQRHYYYFKVTKEQRLLFGFGGVIVNKNHVQTKPHKLHLERLDGFIKKVFPYLDLHIDYAWSGTFGVMKHFAPPLVQYKNDTAVVAGAATQVVCFMAAKHIACKLLGKPSSLDDFFA
jgi:glycine/D-amino acid oxidase-like deaminating enzyme